MNPWSGVAAATGADYRRLVQGLEDGEAAQRRCLENLLQANAGSEFGRRFKFPTLSDPDRFRAAVPLHDYDDFAAAIGRMAGGEGGVLTEEAVQLFERTGGSCGGAKLVPYTRSSLEGFRRAVHPWLHDLSKQYPNLGRSYFAVSPAIRAPEATSGGVPVGADSDLVYFGAELLEPLTAITLTPAPLGAVTDVDAWRCVTLLYLLAAPDLTLLSVWSPTFLIALMGALPRHAEALLRQLHDGVPAPLPGTRPLPPNPERASTIARALAGDGIDTRSIWPQLQVISAWTHASAARFVPGLRRLFPHAVVQGKGLLGTEGVVSIPLFGYDYPVLAVNSGFYEFLDGAGRSHLAHEVEEGGEYEVVMSMPALYRYRTGDRVCVHGRVGGAPQLEFLGRTGLVSDLGGEKLTEAFVASCLKDIQGFAMLAPELEPQPRYVLYVEHERASMQMQVEQRLRRNPQYAHARALGQLGGVQVVAVERPMDEYQAWALARGQRLGDIKPPSLRPEAGWERRLRRALG